MCDISLDFRGIRFLEKPKYICLAAVMDSPVKRRGRQQSSGSSCSLRGKDIQKDDF